MDINFMAIHNIENSIFNELPSDEELDHKDYFLTVDQKDDLINQAIENFQSLNSTIQLTKDKFRIRTYSFVITNIIFVLIPSEDLKISVLLKVKLNKENTWQYH